MSDARRQIAWAKFNQRVTIGQWGALQGKWLTLFEAKTAFQHFRSPRLKTVPQILFNYYKHITTLSGAVLRKGLTAELIA